MINIKGKSVNGLSLGTPKDKIDICNINYKHLFLEFNNKSKLITISFRNVNSFILNDKNINFDNIITFLNEHKVLKDNDFFIIPSLYLSLYIDFNNNSFLEVLIYDSSISDLYKKGEKLIFDKKENIISISNDLTFIPYKSLGSYIFGEREKEFVRIQKLEYSIDSGVNNKKIYEYNSIVFRFDNSRLSQIQINNSLLSSKIILNSTNINSIDGINYLLSHYEITESYSHCIIAELGLAINKTNTQMKNTKFFFFSKELLPFWMNIYRPITSW